MSRYYKERSLRKRVFTIIAVFLAAVILLFSTMFFGFRKYIVYTDDGLYLEIPWMDYNTEN